MLLHRRKGFTLIELLVVIAIIGILASMLFPVFARARESARKIQCLSNVKNIALAIQMYLTDYDDVWTAGRDQAAVDFFNTGPGKGWDTADGDCHRAWQANPYLREPVILDEYTRNRDLWRCASAKVMSGATVIVGYGENGYWLNWYRNMGGDLRDYGPCYVPFPSGWGGSITDSYLQQAMAGDDGFRQGLGVSSAFIDANVRMSSVEDPSKFVTVGDVGQQVYVNGSKSVAIPDYSCSANACGYDNPGCCYTYNPDCPDTRDCSLTTDQKKAIFSDPSYRKSMGRHMGGSNLGFADGHAKWFPMDAILFQSCPFAGDANKALFDYRSMFTDGWPNSPCDQ